MPFNTMDEVLALARNFMASRILLSGAELNIFPLLSEKPLSASTLAEKLPADLRGLTALLDALTALGLLLKKEGLYQCPPHLLEILSDTHPHSALPMILHLAHLWQNWSSLTDIVRGDKKSGDVSRLIVNEKERKAFIGAMHAIGHSQAAKIVTAVQPGAARNLIDIGGASGTYTMAFLEASPGMKATLFDREEVVAMARERLGEAGLLERVTLAGGDFYQDELPPGHDLAFLSAIIHQNSPEQNVELYGKIFRSLKPGGRLVIRDHVMEPDHSWPPSGAIFAINMLVATAGGGTYTLAEIREGLTRAGFTGVRLLEKTETMDDMVEAFKPEA